MKKMSTKLKFVALFFLGFMSACAPIPETDNKQFENEFNEVVYNLESDSDVSLADINFLVVSYDELQGYCDTDEFCYGAGGADAPGNLFVILPDTLTNDHCEDLEPGDVSTSMIIIHELFHVFGYEHGEKMDELVNQTWSSYQERYCD